MEIEIEKMIYGGDGLGRYLEEGENRAKALFIPFVLENERVAVEILEDKRSPTSCAAVAVSISIPVTNISSR